MPKLLSIATATPSISLTQGEMLSHMAQARGRDLPPMMARIMENTGIERRHIAMPPEYYFAGRSWSDRAKIYEQHASSLFQEAAGKALMRAKLTPADIGQIVCVSTTGMMTPGLPSRMVTEMGFCTGTRTVPVFGYGCAGGVIGLGLAADLSRASPDRPVLLVAVELCSLAYDHSHLDKKDMVAAALFADGCAAAVIGAGEGPSLGAFAQNLWPDTRDMMGWEIGETGFDLLLARNIPKFVEQEFAPVCDAFLADQGLDRDCLGEPACHPGGGRVVDALARYFDNDLPVTRHVLASYGNMSSPTVLFVLEAMLAAGMPQAPLLMTALGPGFVGAMGLLHP